MASHGIMKPMELRVLRYFAAVAGEESITRAAEILHLSQPTLSRQLKELEEELGKTLMIRGSKKTTLTEEGRLLYKRANEIIDLTLKTEIELRQSDDFSGGDVWIGGGETDGMRLVARAAQSLRAEYPAIHVHLISGNWTDIEEKLEKGLIDFGVAFGSVDSDKYDSFQLPIMHSRGLLMRTDSALASRNFIVPGDLSGIPVISSRNESARSGYEQWMGKKFDTLNVVATYNLIYNAAFLVEEGVGYALSIDRLVNRRPLLCFVPFEPRLEVMVNLAWKKHQVFSKASQKFLERIKEIIEFKRA